MQNDQNCSWNLFSDKVLLLLYKINGESSGCWPIEQNCAWRRPENASQSSYWPLGGAKNKVGGLFFRNSNSFLNYQPVLVCACLSSLLLCSAQLINSKNTKRQQSRCCFTTHLSSIDGDREIPTPEIGGRSFKMQHIKRVVSRTISFNLI